jgi:hypothetical protein
MGIGVEDPESQRALAADRWGRTTGMVLEHNRRDGRSKGKGKGTERDSDEEGLPPRRGAWEELDRARASAEEEGGQAEQDAMLGQRYKGIREDEGPDISRGRGQMEFEEEEHGVKHLSPLVDLRNLLLEVSTCRLVLYAHCVIPTSLTFPTYSAIVASLYHRSSNFSQQGSCVFDT